jgi:hypothetical protein
MKNVEDGSRENQLFLKSSAVYELMWKNIVERGQATDDNMAHAYCMLDT